jgi:hypothetical protein
MTASRQPADTHAKALHHAGPVCGADDGPITRITEDAPRHLPRLPGPGMDRRATRRRDRRRPAVVELLREAKRGAFYKIDEVVVDPTTAAAILTMYYALKPVTRGKARRADRRPDGRRRMAAAAPAPVARAA